jgi:hypothetical protein
MMLVDCDLLHYNGWALKCTLPQTKHSRTSLLIINHLSSQKNSIGDTFLVDSKLFSNS